MKPFPKGRETLRDWTARAFGSTIASAMQNCAGSIRRRRKCPKGSLGDFNDVIGF
jgi:hypothetical protein